MRMSAKPYHRLIIVSRCYNLYMSRTVSAILLASLVLAPSVAFAFPFGGRASVVLRCVYNSTIYTNLGPPRGGEYIWTTATKTYQFGPPAYAGQWLLGLAGAPYYCIYRISPLTIYTGVAMTMMGSSGSPAPPAPLQRGPSPLSPSLPGTPTSPGSPTPPGGSTAAKVLISEIYHYVDDAHGSKPGNEWVELYNGTQSTVDVSGWTITDNFASSTLPAGSTISAGGFAIVTPTSQTRDLWLLPSSVKFIFTGKIFGDSLSDTDDRVVLRNASGTTIDAVSWGSDTSMMNPSATTTAYGQSLTRISLTTDTDTAADWAARSASPGN